MNDTNGLPKGLSISDLLKRGGDVLKSRTDFKLVGRDRELTELSAVLMKMKKRNLIITGRGGVGISSIILGIQDSKGDHRTPVDIVGKRFFWIDTDKLFESGNHALVNSMFERVRQTLVRTRDAVLVIEDTDDFVKAAQSTGSSHLINGLFGDLKSGRYQAILEAKDENLGEVLKCDGDILEFCTLYEVEEPTADNLRLIVQQSVQPLERHHGIGIAPSALETAVALTEKYKLPELRAQPDAAVSLLDIALTDYSFQIHRSPAHIGRLQGNLVAIIGALSGKSGSKDFDGFSTIDLENLRNDAEAQLKLAEQEWEAQQSDIRRLYKDISDGEDEVRKLEEQIDQLRTAQIENIAKVAQSSNQSGDDRMSSLNAVTSMMAKVNADTPEIAEVRGRIRKIEGLVKSAADQYKAKISEIYTGLVIEESHVLRSFSALSKIPVDKLNEDEREKLRELDKILSNRVIGQDEPTLEVAKAVKRARLGLKMPNKPSGTFMFLGPSGVGKTELAKALAEALGVSLLRFDMSEYMEKHAVAKLIGAPPGYEGYEQGGILTNQMRRNPYSVVLFDEIEKAHADVFNLMLQLLDDARLTDSRGLTASFKDAIIIMTTNIGTPHFLDDSLTFSEAKEAALADLRQEYRPEFLGRFGGNIYCFQRLQPVVLQEIARKDLRRINGLISSHSFQIEMQDDDLAAMIMDKYAPREGARSILGFIDRNITSGIADVVLQDEQVSERILVRYDSSLKAVHFAPAGKAIA